MHDVQGDRQGVHGCQQDQRVHSREDGFLPHAGTTAAGRQRPYDLRIVSDGVALLTNRPEQTNSCKANKCRCICDMYVQFAPQVVVWARMFTTELLTVIYA